MKKATVVSTKLHIGNQKFISIEAVYNRYSIVQLTYNVYKQYGYSMVPIGSATVTENSVESDMDRHYGVVSRQLKEKAFSYFTQNVSSEMLDQIKKIITGE